jgi:hypothetical protein
LRVTLNDTHALRLPIGCYRVLRDQISLTGDTDHFSATMRPRPVVADRAGIKQWQQCHNYRDDCIMPVA